MFTFWTGRDSACPAEKHPDRLSSLLRKSRLGGKQPFGGGGSLKLYDGITQKKSFSQILPQNLLGRY